MNAPINIHPIATPESELAPEAAPAPEPLQPAHVRVARKFKSWIERFGPWIERQQRVWLPPGPDPNSGWGADAEWARLQQEPLRARALVRWTAAFVALLTLWAAFAQVDEVTKGEGRVIPSSQVQVLQSVDGGVVEQIGVREGQTVKAGQLLLSIDPTRFECATTAHSISRCASRPRACRR
jgi:hypothetical protein